MAESLPSPPASLSAMPDENHECNDLTQRLDELLEQYLDLLDQYTTLRAELSQTFSSGFFSLAQAQRASTLGAGRRYGQDCYDERMKAHRRVRTEATKSETVKYVVEKPESPVQADQYTDKMVDSSIDKEDVNSTASALRDQQQHQSSKRRQQQEPSLRDPLRWFGVFVPPALRQTQSHFITATEGSIPKLLSASLKMQQLEKEIWDLRHQLGILAETEETGAEEDIEDNQVASNNETATLSKQQQTSKTSRRTNMASRPAHSRSSLLKLGD